jgi:hypothetical protein
MAFGDMPRAQPASQVVDYMPDATRWWDDLQSRYAAEAAKAGGPSGVLRSLNPVESAYRQTTTPIGYQNPHTGFYYSDQWEGPRTTPKYDYSMMPKGATVDPISGKVIVKGSSNGLVSALDQAANVPMAAGAPGVMGGYLNPDGTWSDVQDSQTQQQGWEDIPYVPDYSALDAEKARMMPMMERQRIGQTAYDSMTGWGQTNGIPGPDYAKPDFGQVTDNFGQYDGAGSFGGLNMDWAADPTAALNTQSGAGLGVYAPRKAPQRQWGI